MNFKSAKDAFRYYAVAGCASDEQIEILLDNVIAELSEDELEEFERQVSPEIERGVFLSPPPMFV